MLKCPGPYKCNFCIRLQFVLKPAVESNDEIHRCLRRISLMEAFVLRSKLHLSHVARLAMVDSLLLRRRCRSVAPFPLKVLRLSGTPKSRHAFWGEGEANKSAYVLLFQQNRERCLLCFDVVRLRVTPTGSVCPF